jgi:hypothetical protein
MKQVLAKTLVVQFYKINTGFFLVAFILLFGLLNGKATIDLHHGIMRQITTSWSFAAGAMAVWMLYNIKCITYCIREIKNPANTFLFSMQSLSNPYHFWLWLSCHTTLLMPMLAYAGVTVAVGLTEGKPLLAVLFAVFQGLLCCSAVVYYRLINNTWRKPLIRTPETLLNTKKRFHMYLLHYSLTMRKGTFIGIKILSLLLLQGMVFANAYEINKESICVLIMFLVSAHALLPVYYVGFMENDLAFIRNLPVRALHKYLVFVFTYAIIFLPELLFLLLNGHHALPLTLTLSLYAVAVSQLALYTSIQYANKITTDRYFMIVTGFFFASLLFLASFNLWVLFAVESVVAVGLFVGLYPRHEQQIM